MNHPLPRREFLTLALAAGAAPLTIGRAQAADQPAPSGDEFPPDFVWGVATAAPQIEGAADEDGKGESIWDRFAKLPGKTAKGDTPAVACAHYHLYKDDFALMKSLGIRHHRLSIAWPRIYPAGTGAVNDKGLGFYDRLIDSMLEHGITPWVTLYHWDLPQALEDAGGWRNVATAEAYGAYAAVVVRKLADRVKNWMTLNEIAAFIPLGYGSGQFAPGAHEGPAALNQCYHHALVAHGYGIEAVRQFGGAGARVGLAHNPSTPVPVTETPGDIAAAGAAYARNNAQLMAPMLTGEYPEPWLKEQGANAPKFTAAELARISQRLDFLGLNLYGGSFVRAGADGKPETLPLPSDYPRGASDWLNILPQVMYWAVRHAEETYGVKDFYITENGVSADDKVNDKGQVIDLGRREFYRNYLLSLRRAVAEGRGVRGFFAWSFMDNFEWSEGYSKRFGIVHVDYPTQKRTPKLSAEWYAQVIAGNRVI